MKKKIKTSDGIALETYDVVEEPPEMTITMDDHVAEEPNVEVKEEGLLTRIWNKTVFPEMIKNKKEEKAMKRQVMKEVRIEALKDMKPELKKVMIQKEKDKLSGKKKKDFLEKLAKGFESSNVGSTDQMNRLLGNDQSKNTFDISKHLGDVGSGSSDNKLKEMLGNKPKKKK